MGSSTPLLNSKDESPWSSRSLTGRKSLTIRQEERAIIQQLPDITDRIHQLGLTEEYHAFKDRYLAWRQGDAKGARGEIAIKELTRSENVAANRGFGYYYPTVQEWLWKRTMSYWIAVTFFEGAIFFTSSSFLYNQQELLGHFYTPMTVGGYLAGEVLFLLGCYLMCLETVNFNVDQSKADELVPGIDHEAVCQETFTKEDIITAQVHIFYWWPYRWKTAWLRLEAAGVGPLPYLISVTYFTGVLAYAVGMAMMLTPGIPEAITGPVKNLAFLVGSAWFFCGGVFECIQNRIGSLGDVDSAFMGAVLNFAGGFAFLAGSVYGYVDAYRCNNLFGIGSLLYCASSSVQIAMWKNEQFGLTFLNVLNSINRTGVSFGGGQDADHQNRFSYRGAIFVHLCCLCGAVATYNFNIEVAAYLNRASFRSLQLAFNEFLPCLFAHLMLMLSSAVMRAPKTAPFRQLFFSLRFVCVALLVNSCYTLIEFVRHDIQE